MWYHLWGKFPRSLPRAEMEPSHLGNQSFSGILIEDVVVYLYVSLLVIITDSTLQYHFSSCLDHSHYFARTKLFEKYKMQLASRLIPICPSGIVPWLAPRTRSLNSLLRIQRGCSSFNLALLLTFFREIAQNPFLYCFVTERKEIHSPLLTYNCRSKQKNWNLCFHLPPASLWFLNWKLFNLYLVNIGREVSGKLT